MIYLTVIKGVITCVDAALACLFGLCIILRGNARLDPAFWVATILFTINSLALFLL